MNIPSIADLRRRYWRLRGRWSYRLPSARRIIGRPPPPARGGPVGAQRFLVECDGFAQSRFAQCWQALTAQQPEPTAFIAPLWQARLLAPSQALERLHLISVFTHEEPRLALPLHRIADGVYETPGAPLTDYLAPLSRQGDDARLWEALLLGSMRWLPGGLRRLTLHNLRPQAPDVLALKQAAERLGFVLEEHALLPTAEVALAPSWEAFLARLRSQDRKELKRHLRRAQERMQARLLVADTRAQVPRALDAVLGLLENVPGERGAKARRVFRPMFDEMAAELAAIGRLRIYRLMLQGELAAGLIALPAQRSVLAWNTAYDPRFAAWGPGIVLMGMAIRDCIERGYAVFDLLRGGDRYKKELGATLRPLVALTLRRPARAPLPVFGPGGADVVRSAR